MIGTLLLPSCLGLRLSVLTCRLRLYFSENVDLDAGNTIGYAAQALSEIKYFASQGLLSPLNKQPKT